MKQSVHFRGPLRRSYTEYCIECYRFFLSCSVLLINCPCRVTNTKCKPNIILSFLVNCCGDIDLQCCNYCPLLSDFHTNCRNVFNYINVRIAKYTKLKVDELKVSWDDGTCKLIRKEHH